jgi:UDP-N-acetylglucosamine acyltransferase
MINQHAIVHPKAQIGKDVSIGPYSIIGKDVTIGDGTKIGPHVVIEGKTKLGKNNTIYQFASVGANPQDKKYQGEETILEVGDDNIIREFVALHKGTVQGSGKTIIGNDNLFMNYVHIAHDCVVGSHCVFANVATLAGHVTVGDFVVFGGFAKVQQFCAVGDYSFVAGSTDIVKDVPPFVLVSGGHEFVKVYGLNSVGLKRHGFDLETLKILKEAYQIIYRRKLQVKEAIVELEKLVGKCSKVQMLIEFLRMSKKGIVR